MIRTAIAAALLATPAAADSTLWCLEARDEGRAEYVQQIAKILLSDPRDLNPEQASRGAECIKAGLGHDYVYQSSTKTFVSRSVAEAAQRAADTSKAAVEARERLLAEAARSKAERQARVVERLHQGCAAMFRRDPDATVTNRLCFDAFMATGLPD